MMADSASLIAKMRNEDRGNVQWAGTCEDVSPLLQGGRKPLNEGGGTRPLPFIRCVIRMITLIVYSEFKKKEGVTDYD